MVPSDMIPGICFPFVFCWIAPLRRGPIPWSEKERKTTVWTVGEYKSVLWFLELTDLKMLYLAYTSCILSRLNFSFSVFVQLSNLPSEKVGCGVKHCVLDKGDVDLNANTSTHRLPRKWAFMLINSNCREVGWPLKIPSNSCHSMILWKRG